MPTGKLDEDGREIVTTVNRGEAEIYGFELGGMLEGAAFAELPASTAARAGSSISGRRERRVVFMSDWGFRRAAGRCAHASPTPLHPAPGALPIRGVELSSRRRHDNRALILSNRSSAKILFFETQLQLSSAVAPHHHACPFSAQLLHDGPGVALRGVDAEVAHPADWSGLLKPGMGHLVLNLDGHGVVLGRQVRLGIVPGTASILKTSVDETVHASRLAGDGRHRFVVISATPAWLAASFGESVAALHPLLRDVECPQHTGLLRSMNLAERDLCESLLQPPVQRMLRAAWFRGKALECFSLFGGIPKFAGHDHDPLRQRIDAATQWLRDHFREDLDLLAAAKHVGCAPHYLSRLFKQHSGKTLSQKLREIRIDRAAALLRNGGFNVTEAAFEVGYNSLSHFTKAFVSEKGVRPSDWRAG